MADMILSDLKYSYDDTSYPSTSSLTQESTGFGLQFTPKTNRVKYQVSLQCQASSASTVSLFEVYYNTTGIPPVNTADSGTLVREVNQYLPSTANTPQEVSCFGVVTGLTPGVTYYLYISFNTNTTSSTVTINTLGMSVESV